MKKSPYRISREIEMKTKQGVRWISWEYYAIKNNQKKVVEIQQVGRDITREKNIEKMKSEFISIASHQLRTPLTGIKWFAELLLHGKSGNMNAEQKDFLQQIYDSNERMIALINDLLKVSRIESTDNSIVQKTLAKISPLLQTVIDGQKIPLQTKNITLSWNKTAFNALSLKINAEQILQVFQNLIVNAINYSPSNSTISIDAVKRKNEIVFSVQDSGIGIPPKQQAHIFEKLFRADNAVQAFTNGTGLGLYICKAFIEAHGGRIWFTSEENKGTIFYFSLPLGTRK